MSQPGCSFYDCTNRAAYKAVYDDRLTGQWLCFGHTISDLNRELPGGADDLLEDIESHRQGIRNYRRELSNRLKRAKTGEPVGPGEPRELDAIGLAHLSGKISGLAAGLAAFDELAEEYLHPDDDR